MNDFIEKRVEEHLRAALQKGAITEDNWFIIAPYGSMNYGLYDYDSDVDTKILIIPDMRDIIENIGSRKTLSKSLEFENEKIEIKDIREYSRILKTGAINFVELLFSDYVKVHPKYEEEWISLLQKREILARTLPENTLSSSLGMAKSKFHSLKKQNFNDFNLKDFIAIARLEFFIENYIKGVPYKQCITVEDLPKLKEMWLGLKHKKVNSEAAYDLIIKEAESLVQKIEKLINENPLKNKNDKYLNDFLYQVNKKLILKRIKEI